MLVIIGLVCIFTFWLELAASMYLLTHSSDNDMKRISYVLICAFPYINIFMAIRLAIRNWLKRQEVEATNIMQDLMDNNTPYDSALIAVKEIKQ